MVWIIHYSDTCIYLHKKITVLKKEKKCHTVEHQAFKQTTLNGFLKIHWNYFAMSLFYQLIYEAKYNMCKCRTPVKVVATTKTVNPDRFRHYW